MAQPKWNLPPLIRLASAALPVILLAGCQAFTGSGAPGSAQIVVGRSDPALDVEAVQKAVDQGGMVLLKGEFNFGDKGNVRITRDVAVSGEVDGGGKPRTTIKGGQSTLRSLRPDGASGPGPKVTIKHLHFDGAAWMPIHVAFSSGTVISGNVISRVKPVPFPPNALSHGKPYNMQQGIVVVGASFEPGKALQYAPDAVTGSLTVTDNEIDLANDAPKTTLSMGIWVMYTTGIDAEIAGNKIRNVSRNGLEVIDNYRAKDGGGRVVIGNNDIETPADGAPFPTPRAPNGISTGYFMDGKAATDGRAVPHTVTRNTVRARGQTPSSVGIALMLDKAVVNDNRVTLEGPGTWGMVVNGSHNRIEQNQLDGSGTFGILVVPVPQVGADNNELTRNEFGQLRAARGNVMLMKGANHNRVVGSTGTVTDLGEGNVTDGLRRTAAASN
jgi:hypothetical protein